MTGDSATKAKAAAVKGTGGGTAGDVTTDMTGKGYEVTVKKTDSSSIEIHLDSSFIAWQGPGPDGNHPGGLGAPFGLLGPGQRVGPVTLGGPICAPMHHRRTAALSRESRKRYAPPVCGLANA